MRVVFPGPYQVSLPSQAHDPTLKCTPIMLQSNSRPVCMREKRMPCVVCDAQDSHPVLETPRENIRALMHVLPYHLLAQ
jgi:hypothetical protein